MSVGLVIPARYASSRLPGKPLISIAGISLIERVWNIASAVKGVTEIVVATDDRRIQKAVEAFGGRAVMTSESCANGTERVSEALKHMSGEINAVINLQGDAVLTPPWIIDPIVEALKVGRNDTLVTPAVQLNKVEYESLSKAKRAGSSSGTLVVTDRDSRALYFSKSLIPYLRNPETALQSGDLLPVYRHIGLYGYTRAALDHYLSLPIGTLEMVEGLEQLRALEHGMDITVVPVSYRGRTHGSVDNQEDVGLIEAIIKKEGELVQCV